MKPATSPLDPAGTTHYYYPNRMGRIILQAMAEILGRHGLNSVLNLAKSSHLVDSYPANNMALGYSFNEIGALHEALDVMFGPRGSRSLTAHAGRVTWKYALNDFVPLLGITDLARRALPLGIKLKIGLDVFSETFNRFSDQVVRLGEDETHYYWHIERCPMCWQRKTGQPSCYLAVGLLQESLYWVSNGRHFQVSETACMACGDAVCTIAIYKKPL